MVDEELIEVNPQLRGVLDMILSAISRPFVSTLGQGIVDTSTLISSALNGVGGIGGNLLNNGLSAVNGMVPVNNDESVPVQQDDDLLGVINALLDHINSEPPKVTTGTDENDEMNLLGELVNEATLNVNNEDDVDEEIPLYLVVF